MVLILSLIFGCLTSCLSAPTLILQGLETMSTGKSRFLWEEHSRQEWDVAKLW